MTRNWSGLASRTSNLVGPRQGTLRRPRRAGYHLESLETRLALSSYSQVLPALNPQHPDELR
jgi:hypothetical protein